MTTDRKQRTRPDSEGFIPYFLWRWLEKLIGIRLTMTFYPPYLGAGVRLKKLSKEYDHIIVEMKQRFWNTNYVGVHFGGALYAMCDPFYMFMLMKRLGPSYMVWDQAANIEFLRPGKGTVVAEFRLSDEELQRIKNTVEEQRKSTEEFELDILDSDKKVVAHVKKKIYVRKLRRT